MKYYDKLIFELSRPGRSAFSLAENGLEEVPVPEKLSRRSDLPLPEVSEPRLSSLITKPPAR